MENIPFALGRYTNLAHFAPQSVDGCCDEPDVWGIPNEAAYQCVLPLPDSSLDHFLRELGTSPSRVLLEVTLFILVSFPSANSFLHDFALVGSTGR